MKQFIGKVYTTLLEGYNMGDIELENNENYVFTNALTSKEFIGKRVKVTIEILEEDN